MNVNLISYYINYKKKKLGGLNMGYLEIFGNNKVAISDKLFNNKNVKYVSIFHMTDDGFGNKHETEGKITFVLNDIQGEKKFNGENIMEVLAQMAEFLESLE